MRMQGNRRRSELKYGKEWKGWARTQKPKTERRMEKRLEKGLRTESSRERGREEMGGGDRVGEGLSKK